MTNQVSLRIHGTNLSSAIVILAFVIVHLAIFSQAAESFLDNERPMSGHEYFRVSQLRNSKNHQGVGTSLIQFSRKRVNIVESQMMAIQDLATRINQQYRSDAFQKSVLKIQAKTKHVLSANVAYDGSLKGLSAKLSTLNLSLAQLADLLLNLTQFRSESLKASDFLDEVGELMKELSNSQARIHQEMRMLKEQRKSVDHANEPDLKKEAIRIVREGMAIVSDIKEFFTPREFERYFFSFNLRLKWANGYLREKSFGIGAANSMLGIIGSLEDHWEQIKEPLMGQSDEQARKLKRLMRFRRDLEVLLTKLNFG